MDDFNEFFSAAKRGFAESKKQEQSGMNEFLDQNLPLGRQVGLHLNDDCIRFYCLNDDYTRFYCLKDNKTSSAMFW